MLIGLDAGTSVVKAVAFGNDGEALRVASRPLRTDIPTPGRAEQDLEAVIAAVGAVVREVAAGEPVELLGITAQGDGLWLLDREGRQVRPPILWSDARAAAIVTEWMTSGIAERAFRRSGNMLFPGAAAPLLAYLQREEPDSLRAAETAGYCKDAILQRLTGVRATDVSDASLPFFDPRTRQYDDELLGAVRRLAMATTPRSRRPLPRSDDADSRQRVLPWSDCCRIRRYTPVRSTSARRRSAPGCERPGDGLVILGTTLGCAVLVDQVETDGAPAGMLLCMPQPDRWVRVMPAMVGTPSLEWALALTGSRRGDVDALLAASVPGAGGLVVLPFFAPAGERAPFVDPAARGQLLGVSLESTRADVVRAVCEGNRLRGTSLPGERRAERPGSGLPERRWSPIRGMAADSRECVAAASGSGPATGSRRPGGGHGGPGRGRSSSRRRDLDPARCHNRTASRARQPLRRGLRLLSPSSRCGAGTVDWTDARAGLTGFVELDGWLARQVVDTHEERVVTAKATRFGRDRSGVQLPSREHAPGQPGRDLSTQPDRRHIQRRADCCRDITPGQDEAAHLTAHLWRGDDLSQPRGDGVFSARARGQPYSRECRRPTGAEMRRDLHHGRVDRDRRVVDEGLAGAHDWHSRLAQRLYLPPGCRMLATGDDQDWPRVAHDPRGARRVWRQRKGADQLARKPGRAAEETQSASDRRATNPEQIVVRLRVGDHDSL